MGSGRFFPEAGEEALVLGLELCYLSLEAAHLALEGIDEELHVG